MGSLRGLGTGGVDELRIRAERLRGQRADVLGSQGLDGREAEDPRSWGGETRPPSPLFASSSAFQLSPLDSISPLSLLRLFMPLS